MANEFIARNGIIALNNTQITGSLNVSAGITGSLLGTASLATTASFAISASWAPGGTGTVTSVSTAGSVNGITLTGGPITGAGTITLGGTLSGIGNAQLTNSAITIAGTSTSLGGSIAQATILAGSGVFSGSAQIANSSIANAQLANSSVTVGSTAISLGSSATTIAGLSSVTSTTFVGALTGNASTATSAATWTTGRTITIGSTGKTVDGSGNVSWTLGEIGAQAALTNPVTGTGTTNYIPKFTGTSAIGNSVMYDDGTNVGVGTTSPNSKLHVVGNTSITGSTNITGSLLVRNGLGTVLDTTNYNLVDGAVTSVAWGNRELKDTNNFATVDWEGLSLASPQGGGIDTVDWGAGYLKSPANGPTSMSINWDDRIAYDENQFDSIDWSSRALYAGGNASVDWGSRLLNDSSTVNSVEWENRLAFNSIGNTSIDWENSITYDGLGSMSIDYHSRRLYNAAGTSLLSWHQTSANLTGTASWATNVVNNGVTSVGGTGTVNGISLSGTVTSTGNLTLGGALANIQSSQLATSSLMIGSTNISLGATGSTLAGLTSVTSTGFTGSLLGQATNVSNAIAFNNGGAGGASGTTFTGAAGTTISYNTIGAYAATNPSGYTTNTGTVTSVATAGSVNGITLTGGTITGTGTITLGGTLSGIGNAQLTNSSITVGSTAISLGASSTTLTGLTSVTSTNFEGTASWARTASNVIVTDSSSNGETFYPTFIGDGPGTSLGFGTMAYIPNLDLLQTTVSQATKVQTVTNSTNQRFYITYVDSNNASYGTYETVYTDAGISYNPSTNLLEATASLAATASKVTTGLVTTNAIHYIPFVDTNHGTTGTNFLGTVATYKFNPSAARLEITGSLFATSITGSLSGTASYATRASQSGYTIQFVIATAPVAPAASTTYRLGAASRNVLTTATGLTRIYVPRPGRIKYVNAYTRTNGTLASAGSSTFFMSKNSTVSESLGTTSTLGSNANDIFTSTAVSMSVVQGDFLEIDLRTPAWGTAPTGLESNAIIYIENNLI